MTSVLPSSFSAATLLASSLIKCPPGEAAGKRATASPRHLLALLQSTAKADGPERQGCWGFPATAGRGGGLRDAKRHGSSGPSSQGKSGSKGCSRRQWLAASLATSLPSPRILWGYFGCKPIAPQFAP